MKRSLLVTTEFPPYIGGVANYYQNFCRRFDNGEIIVLTAKNDKHFEFDSQQSFKILRENLLYKSFWPRWLKMIFILKKIIKKYQIDEVYVGQALPVGEAVYFCRVKYTVFFHGLDVALPSKRFFKKIILKSIIKKSGRIIVNSLYTKQQLLRLGAQAGKISIVYPEVDRNLYNSLSEQTIEKLNNKYSLAGKKILLSVGRIVKRKGFDKVISSLPLSIESLKDLVYVIVGEGPELPALKKLSENLNVAPKVIFTGSISMEELAAFYKLCSAFIMTPFELENGDVEGFGTVYLEADLFDKPVIAYISGGVGDAVKQVKRSYLVKSLSAEDISSAIIACLK
ncbi:glycosyltransferase family 1 protein [Candidatus Parcubacteria bacterium]|nr:MAG: glycosyltransferase family 1 protein [Candidatus Parcubacteria bacterium]